MKLKNIQVQKYRSIVRTQMLKLEDGLTVILGPNNEGKSNLLRALVLAMECLRAVRMPLPRLPSGKSVAYYRLMRGTYEWEADFPVTRQEREPDGQTILTLEFGLTSEERRKFKAACGSAINGDLPLEIRIGPPGATFKVKKPGRGSRTYEKKSREIARFISSTFDFQYIPAIRPSQLSLDVVGSLIDRELSLLWDDPDYQTALKTISDLESPVYERLESDVQANLKHLLPSVKSVRIALPTLDGPRTPRSRLRVPQFIVDDGTATELEAKGDGIKSLVAISLMRASKAGGAAGDLVVAIEEPESHLHPGAVRQMATVLQEMAAEHQVIITTHSPLLVGRGRMEANIIVTKSKATPAKTIKSIRDALGVQVSDNLSAAESAILVEGTSDAQALAALFAARSEGFAELVRAGRVVFDYMEGASNVVYKLHLLRLQVMTPILLVDGDKAGRDCAKKAKQEGDLEEKQVFMWKRPRGVETELEDLIRPECYWDSIEDQFGVSLDRASFDGATGKWSERMGAAFEAGGKTWNRSVESSVKSTVAKCVAANPVDAVKPEFEKLVDNVTGAIVKLASAP